jgi:hypothetical protein
MQIKNKTNKINKTKGGDMLTTVGVPAVLIAANQLYNPSTKKTKNTNTKRSFSKVKGGDITDRTNQLMEQAGNIMDAMKPQTIPPIIYSNNGYVHPPNIPYVNALKIGGNDKKMGAGILTDIAVPAVLVTANHFYRKTNKNRRHKKSRKVSFTRRYYKK